jgi:hypothetical protein
MAIGMDAARKPMIACFQWPLVYGDRPSWYIQFFTHASAVMTDPLIFIWLVSSVDTNPGRTLKTSQ